MRDLLLLASLAARWRAVERSGVGRPTAGARMLAMPKPCRERAPAHDLVRVDAAREASPESVKLRRMSGEDFNMMLFRAVLITGSLALAPVGATGATGARRQQANADRADARDAEPGARHARSQDDGVDRSRFRGRHLQPAAELHGKMLPAMTPFLEQARKAGLPVVYGTRERNMTKWLKEVAPTASDIRIMSMAQDRFFRTDLDKELKARGIKTVILAGWKISGSVTYTSVGAMAHDYTVVIPWTRPRPAATTRRSSDSTTS